MRALLASRKGAIIYDPLLVRRKGVIIYEATTGQQELFHNI